MIELVFAFMALVSGGDVECSIFWDGVKTWNEVIEECKEFQEGYDWEPPIYENDYPHDCFIYSVGQPWEDLVEDCLAGFEAEGYGSYEVQDGDLSLWSISQKYAIPFGALLDANPAHPDLIRVGDVIRLP